MKKIKDIKNMKAVLKFNLEFPDEQKAHLRCIKATDMALVLFDLLCNAKCLLHNYLVEILINIIKSCKITTQRQHCGTISF